MHAAGKKVQQKARLKRFYANAQKALVSGHRKYIFSEESISIKSEIAEGVNLWTAYKDWGFYENYIYIRNLSNQVILVRQSELSAEDHAWLVDLADPSSGLQRWLRRKQNEIDGTESYYRKCI